MRRSQFFIIFPAIINTVLVISALYAPQPLLPELCKEFAVSREGAAALTTVAFVPLGLAPLFYGYLLETVSPLRITRIALLLLVISEVIFALAPNYTLLILVRIGQGVLIPALLTSLMTYLAGHATSQNVQRIMAIYISATIFGGFSGRLLAGAISNLLNWRTPFIILSISLLFGFAGTFMLKEKTTQRLIKPHPRDLLMVLRKPGFSPIYLCIFCLFLCFAAIMNFIPFRLTDISSQADGLRIGMIYSGYIMGIITSLSSPWISRFMKSEIMAMRTGFICFLIALAGFSIPHTALIFSTMFLFCATMFLVHSTASGLINRLAGNQNRGLTNGLYVAFYYAGGSVGSYVPGIAYRHLGWHGLLLLLAMISLLGIAALFRTKTNILTKGHNA